MRALYPLVLVALALLAGTAGYVTHRMLAAGDPAPAPATAALDPVPAARAAPEQPLAWSFATLDGERRRLDAWPAEVVVLNFWATWCPPCLREIPAFVELQARHGADGLQFIGIALDQPEQVAAFVAEHTMNYPVLVGNDDVIRFMQQLGNAIGGLPYTVVLAGGEVVLTHQGEWDAAEAAETLAGLLKTP